MIKVSCPTCGVRLSASEELLGKAVNCQKCNTKFVLSRRWLNEPLVVTAESILRDNGDGRNEAEPGANLLGNDSSQSSTSDAALAIQSNPDPLVIANGLSATSMREPNPAPSASPLRGFGNGVIASEPISRSTPTILSDVPILQPELLDRSSTNLVKYRETSAVLEFFDFRFRRYMTPGIVRVSWFLILVTGSFWILLLSYFYVSSLLQRENFVLPDIRNHSRVLVEPAPNQPTFIIPQFFYNSGLYFSYLMFTLIAVCWTRVIFETIIMIFSIGSHLRDNRAIKSKKK